jgi:lysophospholipid acyltransferase (LPLAT)-like uncharacterized protein
MKLRHPWLIQGIGIAGACLVRVWMNSIRPQYDYAASGPQPVNPRQQRYIYAFWHESMLATTLFRTRIRALVSHHADGEIIAQIFRHLRIGTIRGSTNRGGVGAMIRMVKASCDSHIGILPDGPRGPRRVVQPGLILLAKLTSLPIIGVGVGFTKAWRFSSWDRFAVPAPCSSVRIVTTTPLSVPERINSKEMEGYRLELERRMLFATDDAERWAAGRGRESPVVEQWPRLLRAAL